MCLHQSPMAWAKCNLLKPLWSQEIEQVEELFQVVLERSPCEKQLVIDLVAIQDSKELEKKGVWVTRTARNQGVPVGLCRVHTEPEQ